MNPLTDLLQILLGKFGQIMEIFLVWLKIQNWLLEGKLGVQAIPMPSQAICFPRTSAPLVKVNSTYVKHKV